MRRHRSPVTAAIATATLLLAGCGGGDPAPEAATGDPAAGATVEVLDADAATQVLAERDDLVVIDVRTPEEHAYGHLADAELLDIQSGEFTARLDQLDPDAAYLVYCRTGNRSAAAVEEMVERGFVEVYDAGGFDDLAAAGAATG